MRNLVPFEVICVLAIAAIPFPAAIPLAIPLFVVATVSNWLRGRSWAELVHGGAARAGIGALAGAVALTLAIVIGTPVIAALSERSIEWSQSPIVRGNSGVLLAVGIYTAVTALAVELALRGWIVERVLELATGQTFLAVFIGAIAEAVVTPGDVATRLGAGLFGVGLGWMYVAGGRSVVAPVCARIVFVCGALILESLRVVG
jgi:hypothetical protein